MKTNQRWRWAASAAIGLLVLTVRTEETAVVKKDRVRVRGQAALSSEVITQLKKGEIVTVLEEVAPRKPKRGEPARWAKIQLPPNTPVWVFAPYIETANNTVNIKRLNLRAGPGENYSVIGRIERGTAVRPIRTTNTWMEIEAPTNAYAFVAAEMLEKTSQPPPATPELAANTTTKPAPVEPPPTIETVKPETPPVVGTTPTTAATQPATPPAQPPPVATPPPAATSPVETTPPKRVVSREGTVVISRSIQAPTSYALENRESRRTVNYLHSESEDINLKRFAGKKVIVTGEELIDQRWVNTPIIEVESIRLLP